MSNKLAPIFCFICVITFFSCKSDSNSAASTDPTNTESVSQEDHSGHDHAGHDHSGHNHAGHDHASHDNNAAAKEAAKLNEMAKAGNKPKSFSSIDISVKGIPNPCKLISEEWIKRNTGLDIGDSRFTQGTKRGDADTRSCFIQWQHSNDPNAGLLISVAINPIPEEITDYATVFMRAKKMDGESEVGNEKPYPFKHIEGLGVEALGCHQLYKYYWRQDNDYLFMLAFNLPLSKAEMDKLTVQIGNEVLRNFNIALGK